MKRRHFIKAGAASAGTLLFDAFPYHAFSGTTKKFTSDKVDKALQYALAQEYLDSFTIGSENIDEFEDLTKKIPEASVRG